jgi:putative transposase
MASTIPESDFSLLAFVIMPEHVHLLLVPRPRIETPDPKRLLLGIKRWSSYEIKRVLQERGDHTLLDDLTVNRSHRAVFRFWLPGGGYDRNLTSTDSVQASFDYIHNNPVKRELCRTPTEFEWTSAAQWQDPNSAVPEWMPKIDRLL